MCDKYQCCLILCYYLMKTNINPRILSMKIFFRYQSGIVVLFFFFFFLTWNILYALPGDLLCVLGMSAVSFNRTLGTTSVFLKQASIEDRKSLERRQVSSFSVCHD